MPIYRQDFGQEDIQKGVSVMSVQYVRNLSPDPVNWKIISEFTQEKNHSNVRFVIIGPTKRPT